MFVVSVFCCQNNFAQTAYIRADYDNCSFFQKLTPKEIETNILAQKSEDGFKIMFKIPSNKSPTEFLNFTLTTYSTDQKGYPVGQDAKDWLELENGYKRTGDISVNFHTKTCQKETSSGLDSSGLIQLTNTSRFDKVSGFFNANVDGVQISGEFKNIKIN